MSPRKPPSADSVHVLLKQALHGDDRFLLLDCLFRQNEKVITNSVSLLKPSDVFKLLESHIPMIHDLNYSWRRKKRTRRCSKVKVLERRKKKTLEVLGEDDDEPKSGVLSLPFMVRGHKKKNEAADEEARLALQ
ncbi:hypothetical protein Tco_0824783 [Tanacetum coccineum]|uniref:Uncharacterized protein n=1 Tax=Tanacetum coccineum TaxID=301880 RepID=A0ABQ5ARE2_9ASTR